MTIHILDESVANKIAAGEVIERPASVVKELLENSLDAGANMIAVELLESGKRLIQITDNGTGISSDEVSIAFQRHATSKLLSIDDLEYIRTLGFRGEALASIAAVSQLQITTRNNDDHAATRLRIEGGVITRKELVGAPQGTTISVENLFFNTPARLKFLKADTTEKLLIHQLISRYSMAYPDRKFVLAQGGKELIRSSGSGDLLTVFAEVYGSDEASAMIPVSDSLMSDLARMTIQGYVSQPSLSRANRNQITFFLNGRWIQDTGLSYAVAQAYHDMLPDNRYPLAVLLIEMTPSEVDVNVHPTKTQVRFRKPDQVFSLVQRSVRTALLASAEPPSANTSIIWGTPDMSTRLERLSRTTGGQHDQMAITMGFDTAGSYTRQYDRGSTSEDGEKLSLLPHMRVIGQVGSAYIIAEGPEGIYLIDQQAAHERILYEKLLEQTLEAAPSSQQLLEPIMIELSPLQMEGLEDTFSILTSMGFMLEKFGRNAIRILSIPTLLSELDHISMLREVLSAGSEEMIHSSIKGGDRKAAVLAKSGAIRQGQVLSFQEMTTLVRSLESCKAPGFSPTGRPTMIHISAHQLAREFQKQAQ